MIKRIVKINPSDNPAMKFGVLIRDLEEVAKQRGSSKSELLNELLSDLINYYNEDYEKKVTEFDLQDIGPKTVKEFILYVKRAQKRCMQAEKLERKKQKQEEKKYILNKTNEKINNIDIAQKQQEEDNLKVQQAMDEIQIIVNREYEEGNTTSKSNLLESIRNAIDSNEDNNFNINISESQKQDLLQMLDEKIKFTKDETYYEQVKKFTNDFQFLAQYPEIVDGLEGHSNKRKFTDKEAYNRYYELRTRLNNGFSEESQIKMLLLNPKLNNVDRRILTERKAVMQEKEHREYR